MRSTVAMRGAPSWMLFRCFLRGFYTSCDCVASSSSPGPCDVLLQPCLPGTAQCQSSAFAFGARFSVVATGCCSVLAPAGCFAAAFALAGDFSSPGACFVCLGAGLAV